MFFSFFILYFYLLILLLLHRRRRRLHLATSLLPSSSPPTPSTTFSTTPSVASAPRHLSPSSLCSSLRLLLSNSTNPSYFLSSFLSIHAFQFLLPTLCPVAQLCGLNPNSNNSLHLSQSNPTPSVEQIVSQFLSKALHAILAAQIRYIHGPTPPSSQHTRKCDCWFQLALYDPPPTLEHPSALPLNGVMEPLVVDILLSPCDDPPCLRRSSSAGPVRGSYYFSPYYWPSASAGGGRNDGDEGAQRRRRQRRRRCRRKKGQKHGKGKELIKTDGEKQTSIYSSMPQYALSILINAWFLTRSYS